MLFSPVASASVITYSVGPGATDPNNGGPVDAFASFSFSTNSVTVSVWNAEVNPTAINQNISEVFFVLSGGQTSGTLMSSSGTSLTVHSGGTYTNNGTISSTNWALVNSFVFNSATGLDLCDAGCGAGGPKYTIIGSPGPTGTYTNANSSLTGASNNPILYGTAAAPVIFTLSVPGVTAYTTISSLAFNFSTSDGDWVQGVSTAPEPATLTLVGLSLIGLGGLHYRRKKRSATSVI